MNYLNLVLVIKYLGQQGIDGDGEGEGEGDTEKYAKSPFLWLNLLNPSKVLKIKICFPPEI